MSIKLVSSRFRKLDRLLTSPSFGGLGKDIIVLVRLNLTAYSNTDSLPLSKQYIYAGSRLLAVKDAGVDTPAPSDLTVWRPSSGVWYCLGGPGSQQFAAAWGNGNLGDKPTPGDYDGDTKTDLAIWRPATGVAGTWWIYRSSNGTYYTETLGGETSTPAQADYDGDGKTDVASFTASTGGWVIKYSSNSQTYSFGFGTNGDAPVPADYTGDGKSDPAIWRNSTAAFWGYSLADQQTLYQPFGAAGDKPVPADYDGDGRADYATWRGSDNNWRILQSSNSQTQTITWGVQSTDIAVPSDYDADGKIDIAVWRSSGTYVGYWYIRKSSDGSTRTDQWGIAGDIPVPSRYRR
ncbi:MAG TPA: VCBS repeat-containing protein [Pyrinomonadaceae bacterium]|nr:VCBS repeat-containing protein [Pyrinomonadaceae bacterium]